MPISKPPIPSSIDLLTCQCAISYHVTTIDGRKVAVLDEPLPDLMVMCFGRCERCGLPYHTEFTADEILS